jgi:hypothetical protein
MTPILLVLGKVLSNQPTTNDDACLKGWKKACLMVKNGCVGWNKAYLKGIIPHST